MKRIKNGLFVVFEGGEGSGKTTIAKRLAKQYEDEGFLVKYTREPGGVPEAEAIRNILVNNELDATTQALLFAASRKLNTDKVINPYLQRGYIVISDRYTLSSIVYQGKVNGFGVNEIIDLQEYVIARKPDIEFVLSVDAEIGLKRAAADNREFNYLDSLGIEYHTKINNAYKENYDEASIRHDIDANLHIDAVYASVFNKFGRDLYLWHNKCIEEFDPKDDE